jgi:hypothetical protein
MKNQMTFFDLGEQPNRTSYNQCCIRSATQSFSLSGWKDLVNSNCQTMVETGKQDGKGTN